MGKGLLETMSEIFGQIAQETVNLMPKIFITLVIILLTGLIIKALNYSLRKLLKIARLDDLFKQITGVTLTFSLSSLIIFLADLGVALISLYNIVSFLLGTQYVELMTYLLGYSARIVSIIVITIILFASFIAVIGKVRMETRLRGYTMFIILILVTAMLIDVTALSEHVKNALITGLSLGAGISIGVFAVWFFFHDYLDELARAMARKRRQDENASTEHHASES